MVTTRKNRASSTSSPLLVDKLLSPCSSYLGNILIILLLFLHVVPQIGSQFSTDISKDGLKEYCQSEYFNVSCGQNKVLYMTAAHYGRMSSGRCVTAHHGALGCSKNVLPFMDKKCSGKQKCQVYIAEPELHDTKPCPRDFSSYLEASYECVPVVGDAICGSSGYVDLEGSEGFLASSSNIQADFLAGTAQCPWRIKVKPGQRVSIKLFNLGQWFTEEDLLKPPSSTGIRRPGDICYELAKAVEDSGERSITACNDGQRESLVYNSDSHVLSVYLIDRDMIQSVGPFLLKYQATGCAEPKIPKHATMRMESDSLVVRCNQTPETWTLVCKDTEWIGEVGNCSGEQAEVSWDIRDILPGEDDTFPYGILLLVAIGVALGVFLGGLLLTLAIYYLKRKQRRETSSRSPARGATDLHHEHPKLLQEEHHAAAAGGHWSSSLRRAHTPYEPCDPRLPPPPPDLQLEVQQGKDGTYQCRPCRVKAVGGPPGFRPNPHVYESPHFA